MKPVLTSSRRIAKSLYLSAFAGLILTLTTPAPAQWPTDYLAPKIMGGGTNARAGTIMATASGGVYMAYDGFTEALRQINARHFNSAGEQLFTDMELHSHPQFAIHMQFFNTTDDRYAFLLYTHFAKPYLDSTEPTYTIQYVKPNGSWATVGYRHSSLLQKVITTEGNLRCVVAVKPGAQEIDFRLDDFAHSFPIAPGERVLDFDIITAMDQHALFSYTRAGQQPGCPREVWTAGGYVYDDGFHYLGQIAALDGAEQDQFDSSLTDLGGSNIMLNWLQTLDGVTSLYAKPVDYRGAAISTPRKAMDNIVDYEATSSTLGLPVFAAVQEDNTAEPPVDVLIGGLINPSNGGTATIPIASGPDVKVKDLRQMANGDFRLTYSVLEGGTNLLKVRGVSGVTAGTLWETTVADLGRASDEAIETYPNTFVASNNDNVLYILARYDQPGTVNSLFQAIRVQADGAMGPN